MGKQIIIGGTVLPVPTKLTVTESDIDSDSTGRSEAGYLSRERLRASVTKLGLEFWNLSVSDARLIHTAVTGAALTVQFPFLGETVTKIMYASDREWTPKLTENTEHWSVSFTLTEY